MWPAGRAVPVAGPYVQGSQRSCILVAGAHISVQVQKWLPHQLHSMVRGLLVMHNTSNDTHCSPAPGCQLAAA